MTTGVANANLVEQCWREDTLIARRRCPGACVLRPQRTAGDAAPFRQRRHRHEPFVEVRDADERVVTCAQLLVDSRVPLILVIALAANAPEVVGRAGGCWQRVALEQQASNRVDAVGRDHATRKWPSRGSGTADDRGCRVINDWHA